MAKINDIIKAKLSDKSDMPDWYYKRLEICKSCPLYSLNYKPETIPDKTRYGTLSVANLGEPFCWRCGCEIEAKASIASEECPNTPQKWGKERVGVGTIDNDYIDFKMTNLSDEKVTMNYKRSEFVLDYGDIEYDSDTKVKLRISPKTELDFINLEAEASCGCTTPKVSKDGRDIIMEIEYDSKRLGEFKKLVSLKYTSNKKNQILIRIKGKVEK